jgi:hypothetical protein
VSPPRPLAGFPCMFSREVLPASSSISEHTNTKGRGQRRQDRTNKTMIPGVF